MFNDMKISGKCTKIKLEKFIVNHQTSTYLIIFFGMPVFLLLAIVVCTTAIVLPISLLFSWL